MVIKQQQKRRGKLPIEELHNDEEREVHAAWGHSASLLGRHLLCLNAAGGCQGWKIGGRQEKVSGILLKLFG